MNETYTLEELQTLYCILYRVSLDSKMLYYIDILLRNLFNLYYYHFCH